MPTASITASGPRPPVSSRIASGAAAVVRRRSTISTPCRRAHARGAPGTRSTPIDALDAEVLGDPRAELADRAEPEHGERAALRDVGVRDRLPGRRQHVGQVEEPLVRRPLRHLDRAELRLRHAQELGLAARHLAVQLRVAEQRRALAVLVHLRRLALRVQLLVAHAAVAAGDVERDHDPVAGLDVA